MKIWIGIVLAVIVVGGGAYWWMQQNQSTQTQTQEEQHGASASTQAATLANVKVGNKIGDFTVTNIQVNPYINAQTVDPKKDLLVHFAGQTTVKGTWESGGFFGGIQFMVNKSDNPLLPHFLLTDDSKAELVTICLSNEAEARAALTGKTGTVSIKITDYVADFTTETETCDQSKLVQSTK